MIRDYGHFFCHRSTSRSPPRDSGDDSGGATILPIEDRSPAGPIPLHNAYSERVDQYDRLSVHAEISMPNDHSVPKDGISPRNITYIVIRHHNQRTARIVSQQGMGLTTVRKPPQGVSARTRRGRPARWHNPTNNQPGHKFVRWVRK